MTTESTVPTAVPLDARIDEILQTLGERTIANMTQDEIAERIEALRKTRAANGQKTLSDAGVVLKKCPKTKARKREHTHVCDACGAEYQCAIGEGCVWAKRVPACGVCMPDCTEEFADTWKTGEQPDAEQ